MDGQDNDDAEDGLCEDRSANAPIQRLRPVGSQRWAQTHIQHTHTCSHTPRHPHLCDSILDAAPRERGDEELVLDVDEVFRGLDEVDV